MWFIWLKLKINKVVSHWKKSFYRLKRTNNRLNRFYWFICCHIIILIIFYANILTWIDFIWYTLIHQFFFIFCSNNQPEVLYCRLSWDQKIILIVYYRSSFWTFGCWFLVYVNFAMHLTVRSCVSSRWGDNN